MTSSEPELPPGTAVQVRVSPGASRLALGLATVALTLGALALAGRGARAGSSAPAPLPVAVVHPAAVGSFSLARSYSGRVRPPRAEDLGFERGGRIAEVRRREGDRVAAGEVLACLDARALRAQRRELEAQRASAAAALDELREGPRRETIAVARARVEELARELDLLRLKQGRREELLAQGVVAREQLDEARAALASQEARLEAARRALEELEAGTRPERLAAEAARVAALDAALERLAVELDQTELRSPFAGVVGEVEREPGAVVAPGERLLRLVADGAPEVWVGVAPAALPRLPVGSEQTLRCGTARYAGRVEAVLPELDPVTRTATVVVRLEGACALLPEQIVQLELLQEVEEEGLWLPLDALTRGERDLWSCLVLAGAGPEAVLERRLVRVLHVEEGRVLVRGSLDGADRVVGAGLHRVVPGQRVRALPAGSPR